MTLSSIALDVGGTFVKAARVADGKVLDPVVRHSMPGFVESDFDIGARELAPEKLDSAVFEALKALNVGDVSAHDVFISGQMAGLAFVDDNGRALENVLTWQDTRYGNVDAVVEAMGSEATADLGDGLRVGSPAVTLVSRNIPVGTYPTSLIAYVAGRIAGQRVDRVHATDAGSWGLFDTRRMRWSAAACQAAGVDPKALPTVVSRVEYASSGTRVRTAIGDQQAALFGAGLNGEQVSINLATGCQVSILRHEFATTAQTRPFLDDHYLHTVTHLPSGRHLAAVILQAYGDVSAMAWSRAAEEFGQKRSIVDAVESIAQGIVDAVHRLNANGREVLFSGGLVQRFTPIRTAILNRLGDPAHRVFPGDDAALAGLAKLSSMGLAVSDEC